MGEKEEVNLGNSLTSIRHMKFIHCPKLERYNCPDYIEELEIRLCPLVRPTQKLPSTLKTLSFWDGKNVEESWVVDNSLSTSLERLDISGWASLTSFPPGSFTHLTSLSIWDCGSLTSFPPGSFIHLTSLEIWQCASLTSFPPGSFTHLTSLSIKNCGSLTSFPPGSFIHLTSLEIWHCGSLTSFPPGSFTRLTSLWIKNCGSLTSFPPGSFIHLTALIILDCKSLTSFPPGCFVHLTSLTIDGCDGIESIPESSCGFLPLLGLRSLILHRCKNLKRFPYEQLQRLTSLVDMTILECPSMEESFPGGVWPPSLTSLRIGILKKEISEWGQQYFSTSLVSLFLHGDHSGVVSFVDEGSSSSSSPSPLLLPPSLTSLEIYYFKELECVSKGLQHLTSLQHLSLIGCPKIRDLPDNLLPSLSYLQILDCSKLEKMCSKRRDGSYWPLVSQIPHLDTYDNGAH